MDTITTTTFVLQALKREITNKYPEMSFVYSVSLQYPYTELQDRADSSDNFIKPSNLPLMAFNRSTLRPSELGSRGNRFSAYLSIPDTPTNVTKYRTAHCEFDFNFSIVDKDMAAIESFELDFMSKEGLGRITEFEVDFSSAGLGLLKYYITWNPQLSDLDISTDQNSYVSLGGNATIRGFFVSLYGESPVITSINLALNDQFKQIEDITIS